MVDRISRGPSARSAPSRGSQSNAARARLGNDAPRAATVDRSASAQALRLPAAAERLNPSDQAPGQVPHVQVRPRAAHAPLRGLLAGFRLRGGAAAAPATRGPLSPEQMVAAWQSWASKPHVAASERRAEAVQRVIASISGSAEVPTSLNLAGLGLNGALPPVPEHVTHLNLSRNPGISSLTSVPASLVQLNASLCGLRQLPPFPQGSQLQQLYVNANAHLRTLPELPASLVRLQAVHCGLRRLPPFPQGSQLRELHVYSNRQLHTLPALPPSLTTLVANHCGLRALPPFPAGSQLHLLLIHGNRHLQSLPTLPASLRLMDARDCGLRELPPFPQGSQLERINLNSNPRLQSLPPLPPSLTLLNAGGCGFRQLPPFPVQCQLREININGNRHLRTVPSLPPSLIRMQIEHCGLHALPTFPEASELQELSVNSNPQLQRIPPLPVSLVRLQAQRCALTQLPTFANNSQLQVLDVSHNPALTELGPIPSSLQQLDARQCAVRQVADFPANSQLEQLFLASNRLTRIPPLPPLLQTLWVDQNRSLNALPDCPGALTRIAARGCALTELPELGESVQDANFSGNQIRALTQRAQPSVVRLNLTHNPVGELPEWVYRLNPHAEVLISTGHMSDQVRTSVRGRAAAARAAGTGPRMVFDLVGAVGAAAPALQVSQRTLGVAASAWRDQASEIEAHRMAWRAFEHEHGAQEFANFLDRLSLTTNHVSMATRMPFRQSVQQLLDEMANSPQLREDCFAVCVGATETCEDRVTLSFQQMAVPRLAEAVRRGDFDSNDAMPGLIDHVRSLYRREVLTEVANRKVAGMRVSDPIEVHLAYQIGLNDTLELRLDALQMRFQTASGVTPSDLQAAELEVHQRENQEFVNHLVNHSAPWLLLMNRRAPELYSQLMQAKHQAVEPHRLAPAIRAHLARLGLPNDADTTRQAGRIVSDELTLHAQRPFVEQFLRRHGHDPQVLLRSKWLAF